LSQKSSFLKNFCELCPLQCTQATDFPVALETIMITKVLLIGGVTAASVLAGGWALAQTQAHDHGTTDSAQHTQGMGPDAMGHAHMQQKMQHMGQQHMGMQHQGQGGMGPGMMQHKGRMGPGMGKGMMQHKGMQNYQGGAMGPGMQGSAGSSRWDRDRHELRVDSHLSEPG
jgi:hypothetical protein